MEVSSKRSQEPIPWDATYIHAKLICEIWSENIAYVYGKDSRQWVDMNARLSQSHLKSDSLTRTLMCRYHTLVRKVCHHHLAAPGVTSTELESLWVLSQNLFLKKRFLHSCLLWEEVRWPEAECKWVWPARQTPWVPSSTVTTRKQFLRNARLNPTHPKWSSLCADSWDPTCPSFFSLPYLTQTQSIQVLLTTPSPSFSLEWTWILGGR